MAENSKIEWTTHTFNTWRGCTKVSAGCTNCYADTLSKRNPLTLGVWGPSGTRVVAAEKGDSGWSAPVKWNKAAACDCAKRLNSDMPWHLPGCPQEDRPRVFCASLADVFEDWTGPMSASDGRWLSKPYLDSESGPENWQLEFPDSWNEGDHQGWRLVTMQDVRRRLFELIDATPNLDWLLLTKRPENVAKMMPPIQTRNAPDDDERWKPIPGHAPYLASSHGRIKGPRGILAGDENETGHRRVTMHGERGRHREQSYRLVLLAFVGEPPDPDCQARHLDGDTSNNCLNNLAWGSQSKNWDDSKSHRTHQRYTKLTSDQVKEIRRRYADGQTFAGIAAHYPVSDVQIRNICTGKHWQEAEANVRGNLWLGTSVENQAAADERIPHLLRTPAAVRFLSCEPLLGPVEFSNVTNRSDAVEQWGKKALAGIDWVIVGGESGPGARPCDVAWVRSIVQQCKTAGVPAFVKQLGAAPRPGPIPSDLAARFLKHKKGGDMAEWPEDLRVREFPKGTVPA